MAYKTGGYKTTYYRNDGDGYILTPYTIYCALESVSDVEVFRMLDEFGNEVPIELGAVDDASHGNCDLIDCLHALRHKMEFGDIVIDRMTDEEMSEVFHQS